MIHHRFGLALFGAFLLVSAGARSVSGQTLPDLVTTDTLRVCSDPGNMPFSDKKGGGLENKIAEIIADGLKVKLRYYWLTQGPGFVRNTLGTGLCDLIIGTSGGDIVQLTNPYYRSAYVLASRKGELSGADSIGDTRLKEKRIGIVAGTPPYDRISQLGIIGQTQSYAAYMFDPQRKHQTVAAEIIADLAAGKLDAAILWGPAAGWLAKQSGVAMDVVPLLKEPDRPPMTFRVAMGVRHNENDWKRKLNTVIRKRQTDIDAVLREFDVPLLEEEGMKLLEPAKN